MREAREAPANTPWNPAQSASDPVPAASLPDHHTPRHNTESHRQQRLPTGACPAPGRHRTDTETAGPRF
ncbi:hypothetical protein GCM10012275_60310 [Longimycelium tulufanense]|uniref:Uncharacterized protein n=1 Tax=Longimycelium tulufanense TaxID=907463 RepID=A0A8J3CIM0_9PSEU|nr:hypothetical protein GCM10012275_60310 [Longimycelium tulufanense]